MNSSHKDLLLGHRSLIKNNTQTAVINMINLRIIYKLDVSYASQHSSYISAHVTSQTPSGPSLLLTLLPIVLMSANTIMGTMFQDLFSVLSKLFKIVNTHSSL